MIRSHFFLLCLVFSCYNNFNLAKTIDECLNQWCQFGNAETTEIELPFQILDGDYFELKTAEQYFYNVRVSFYSTEKTKWYISDYFRDGVQSSFYLPSEYFGGNRSDVDDSCGPSFGRKKHDCEKKNECKVMFAMDEERKISFPSLSIKKMELWKYFDKIVLGGGSGEQIIQFKYVASSDTSTREKPLPFNDELDKHVNKGKEECHIFQKYPFSPPLSTTTAPISTTTTTQTSTISTTTPTMSSSSSTTASTTYIPTTNTGPSDGNTLSTTPTNPSSTSLGQNASDPTMPTSKITSTPSISSSTTASNTPPVIPGSSTPPNRNTISTTSANNPNDPTTTTPLNTNHNNGSSSSAKPPINGNNSSKPICIDSNNCPNPSNPTPSTPKKNEEKTTTAKIATAGSSGGLTDKNTWVADENGWVGDYANRNRALIFVFGNCVIFAAFFTTIFAMTCGGCLFNDT